MPLPVCEKEEFGEMYDVKYYKQKNKQIENTGRNKVLKAIQLKKNREDTQCSHLWSPSIGPRFCARNEFNEFESRG